MKDLLGYILLVAAIVGVFGGMRFGSGGNALGWVGVAGGIALAVVAYRLMTVRKEAPATDGEDGQRASRGSSLDDAG